MITIVHLNLRLRYTKTKTKIGPFCLPNHISLTQRLNETITSLNVLPHPTNTNFPIFVSFDGAVQIPHLKPKNVQTKIYARTDIEVTKSELPTVDSGNHVVSTVNTMQLVLTQNVVNCTSHDKYGYLLRPLYLQNVLLTFIYSARGWIYLETNIQETKEA